MSVRLRTCGQDHLVPVPDGPGRRLRNHPRAGEDRCLHPCRRASPGSADRKLSDHGWIEQIQPLEFRVDVVSGENPVTRTTDAAGRGRRLALLRRQPRRCLRGRTYLPRRGRGRLNTNTSVAGSPGKPSILPHSRKASIWSPEPVAASTISDGRRTVFGTLNFTPL